FTYAHGADRQDQVATRFSQYEAEVVPAMESLKAAGKIAHWGVTGIGQPDGVLAALGLDRKPAVVQAIANLMDSAGGLNRFGGPARPREIVAAAKAAGCGVMGIRAVQAGALTREIDHAVSPNYPTMRRTPLRSISRFNMTAPLSSATVSDAGISTARTRDTFRTSKRSSATQRARTCTSRSRSSRLRRRILH
ncbi:MAG TPA: aldo/keto reductase, partial [Thermoanaerobaculia bacterium]